MTEPLTRKCGERR